MQPRPNVSDRLESFKKYDNVTLYTNVHHDDIIEDLLDQSEIYLDINHWDQVDSIVDRAFEKEKPVFAFDNVVHRAELGASVFSHQDPEMMVKEISETIVWNCRGYSKLKKGSLVYAFGITNHDNCGQSRDFPCLRRI